MKNYPDFLGLPMGLEDLDGLDCHKDGNGVPVLFCERIAEVLKGLDCPQYSDNVLVGSED